MLEGPEAKTADLPDQLPFKKSDEMHSSLLDTPYNNTAFLLFGPPPFASMKAGKITEIPDYFREVTVSSILRSHADKSVSMSSGTFDGFKQSVFRAKVVVFQ